MAQRIPRLLVGTSKGAFVLDGTQDRSAWTVRGPYCDGWPINHVVGDPATGAMWAGGGGDWFGAGVWRSADGGHTWEVTRLTSGEMDTFAAQDPGFAEFIGWTETPLPFGDRFADIWSMARIGNRVYAGTKPARLLASDDEGRSWHEVEGLTNHPSAKDWGPGAAGLVLHSILGEPDDAAKLWVGISAAGVFASTDGGATWERRNHVAPAEEKEALHPAAPEGGEVGLCVHNLDRAGGVLYQQNHYGVWRSADDGKSWEDVNTGLPSTFGFPVRVHPRNPQMVWTLPLNGDMEGRFPPDASAAVWRSTDGGATWEAQRAGLPQQACFFTVLRQGMAVDREDSVGVYFGTNSGSVFASREEGVTWDEIARHLPAVKSVEAI